MYASQFCYYKFAICFVLILHVCSSSFAMEDFSRCFQSAGKQHIIFTLDFLFSYVFFLFTYECLHFIRFQKVHNNLYLSKSDSSKIAFYTKKKIIGEKEAHKTKYMQNCNNSSSWYLSNIICTVKSKTNNRLMICLQRLKRKVNHWMNLLSLLYCFCKSVFWYANAEKKNILLPEWNCI